MNKKVKRGGSDGKARMTGHGIGTELRKRHSDKY
jgi:hypothetical protein